MEKIPLLEASASPVDLARFCTLLIVKKLSRCASGRWWGHFCLPISGAMVGERTV